MTTPKKVSVFENIAPAAIGAIWGLQTSDKLSHVLQPGYLDRYAADGPRRHDRLMVTANVNGEAECCWLIVEENEKGKVRARVLNGGAP